MFMTFRQFIGYAACFFCHADGSRRFRIETGWHLDLKQKRIFIILRMRFLFLEENV